MFCVSKFYLLVLTLLYYFQRDPPYDVHVDYNHNVFKNPSLVPWSGKYNFQVQAQDSNDKKEKNKWQYNRILNKVFVLQNQPFPVEISLSQWPKECKISVMAVYKDTHNHATVVKRCHTDIETHKKNYKDNLEEHLAQIEGPAATYIKFENRYGFTFDLPQPSQGESSSIVLLKSMCLTSCVGGPNRRPIVFVLTLWENHQEIGRQVINFKCCKGPHRDMTNELKSLERKKNEEKKKLDLMKRENEISYDISFMNEPLKKKKKIKKEPDDNGLITIQIPAEFEGEVKKFVNSLALYNIMKYVDKNYLPFPDAAN